MIGLGQTGCSIALRQLRSDRTFLMAMRCPSRARSVALASGMPQLGRVPIYIHEKQMLNEWRRFGKIVGHRCRQRQAGGGLNVGYDKSLHRLPYLSGMVHLKPAMDETPLAQRQFRSPLGVCASGSIASRRNARPAWRRSNDSVTPRAIGMSAQAMTISSISLFRLPSMPSLSVGRQAVHPDPSLNFQVSRWFSWVGQVDMLEDMRTVAPPIATFADWQPEYATLDQQVLEEGKNLMAGFYLRATEFFLLAGDSQRKPLRGKFMQLTGDDYGVTSSDRHRMPNADRPIHRFLPVYRFTPPTPKTLRCCAAASTATSKIYAPSSAGCAMRAMTSWPSRAPARRLRSSTSALTLQVIAAWLDLQAQRAQPVSRYGHSN